MFKAGWRDCPDEWCQPSLSEQFHVLRNLRDTCNKALDEARSQQKIRSSLEASAHIHTNSPQLASLISSVFPKDTATTGKLASNHHHSLSEYLIVSQASLADTSEGDVAGCVQEVLNWPDGEQCLVEVSVRVSCLHKCPRCWRHTSEEKESPCARCQSVLKLKDCDSQ